MHTDDLNACTRMADGWVIDVCATCGRQAIWPFCEHRDTRRSWCEPVVVAPVEKRGRALAALQKRMDEQRRKGSHGD